MAQCPERRLGGTVKAVGIGRIGVQPWFSNQLWNALKTLSASPFIPASGRPQPGLSLDTHSHLWPDSDERTGEAVNLVLAIFVHDRYGLKPSTENSVAGQRLFSG